MNNTPGHQFNDMSSDEQSNTDSSDSSMEANSPEALQVRTFKRSRISHGELEVSQYIFDLSAICRLLVHDQVRNTTY